jgi:hypothetical protein
VDSAPKFARRWNDGSITYNFDALMLVQKEIQSGAVTDVEKGMLAKAFGLPAEFGRATKEELERAKNLLVNPALGGGKPAPARESRG